MHTKCCEFFVGFSYDLDENPACSIGGERAIEACGGSEASLLHAALTTGCPETMGQGDPDAVDDLCDPAGIVAVRDGESYTIGGFIHILLVIAVVVLLIRLIQGRRPIP